MEVVTNTATVPVSQKVCIWDGKWCWENLRTYENIVQTLKTRATQLKHPPAQPFGMVQSRVSMYLTPRGD